MRPILIPMALLMLASASPAAQPRAAPLPEAAAWEIGPIIRRRNHSVGMPLHPTPSRDGWYFDFPYPDVRAGHVHYVTYNPGSLIGKRRIVLRYRVEAARGVRFVAREFPELPATISLYFQRRGDTWSARGAYASYRWYAPVHTVAPITPGEHEMIVDLDDNWINVTPVPASADPRGFRAALADVDRIGIVFGSHSGRGHGVYATGPARLTVLSFSVI